MIIEAKDLIVPLISIIVMLIPIGGLFWKIAQIVFRVHENKNDIDNIGKKLNQHIENQEKKLGDLAAVIGHANELVTRMEVRMTTMLDTINEIKKKLYP